MSASIEAKLGEIAALAATSIRSLDEKQRRTIAKMGEDRVVSVQNPIDGATAQRDRPARRPTVVALKPNSSRARQISVIQVAAWAVIFHSLGLVERV